MCDSFKEEITVIDEWTISNGEVLRLVNKGAGADEVQIMRDGKWEAEKDHFVHGLLTHRIKTLKGLNDELVDFAIWMTGCGYDFCQHDYYVKQRKKLLVGTAKDGDDSPPEATSQGD